MEETPLPARSTGSLPLVALAVGVLSLSLIALGIWLRRSAAAAAIVLLAATGSAVAAPPADFIATPNQCAAWAVLQAACASGTDVGIDGIQRLLPADGEMKSLLQVKTALARLGVESAGTTWESVPSTDGVRVMVVPVGRTSLGELGVRAGKVHFVTGVGRSRGKVHVLNGPGPLVPVAADRLAESVAGPCLQVGTDPAPANDGWVGNVSTVRFLAGLIVGLLCILTVGSLVRRRLKSRQPVLDRCVRTGVAVGCLSLTGCFGSTPPAMPDVPSGSAATAEADAGRVRSMPGSDVAIEVLPNAMQAVTYPAEVVEAANAARRQEGAAVVGITGKAVFTLHNLGTQPVRVVSVQTTCGCTAADIEAGDLLPAGGERKVTVEMSTDMHGETANRVFIRTDSAARPQITLSAYAEPIIRPPFVRTDLDRIHLADFTQGGETLGSFTVETMEPNDREGSWLVGAGLAEDDGPVASFTEVGSENHKLGRLVRYRCELPVRTNESGTFERRLTLEPSPDGSGSNFERELAAIVHYRVVPPVRCIPNRISASCRPAEAVVRRVMVMGRGGRTAVVRPPSEPPPDWLRVEVVGGGLVVTVQAPAEFAERLSHDLRLRTETDEIVLPVVCEPRGR